MRLALAATVLLLAASPALSQEEGGLAEKCQTKSQTFALFGKPEQRLSFSFYECPPDVAPAVSFAIKDGGTLVMRYTVDGPVEATIARFWPLNGERPSARIQALAAPETPVDERMRCEVIYDFVQSRYFWTPVVTYVEDLVALDEPFAACGTYGDSNDSEQYWKTFGKALIGYFWIGQDDPLFDPDSFTFVNDKEPGKAG